MHIAGMFQIPNSQCRTTTDGVLWMNIFEGGAFSAHSSRKEADIHGFQRIGVVEVPWARGDGL